MTAAPADRLPHGGRLAAARVAFPDAPRPWIDISTGINPVPYPIPDLPGGLLARLPEPEALAGLEAAAAAAFGCRDPALVAAAPGTQVLIGLLPLLHPPARVAILGPTYAEHAACWAAAGHAVATVETPDALAEAEADVAVLCNPNNPDGRRLPASALVTLADRLAARGGWLVADEAFADLEAESPGQPPDGTASRSPIVMFGEGRASTPCGLPRGSRGWPAFAGHDGKDQHAGRLALSLAPVLPHPAIVVLRSFGKPYGLAGLRLGFALAPPPLMTRLRAALGPWPVSGPAIAIGTAALGDAEWRHAAAARLAQDAARLDAALDGAGLRVLGGTRLFRLATHPSAPAIADALGRAGILVRRFADAPDRLRFGLPAPADWPRVDQALRCLAAT